jgi:hypothetical protein
LTISLVPALAINSEGTLFAGTRGGGVFGSVETTTDAPPSAPEITAPGNNGVLFVGGADRANALDPSTPFLVTWTPSIDPEGQAVTYTWQLATADDFASATVLLEENTGTAPRYETTYGALSAVLDANNVALNQGLNLFHRAIAFDGRSSTPGATALVTLIRGTLTATDDEADVPEAFTVHGNYPNPFNPTTTIVFDLAESAEVRVEITDLLGRLVQVLSVKAMAAGSGRSVEVEAGDLASGTYLYRVVARTAMTMQVGYGRMVLLK